jgi:WD40 repeat protein
LQRFNVGNGSSFNGTVQATWDGTDKLVVYDTVTGHESKSLLMAEGIGLIRPAFNLQANLIAVGQADGQILLVEMGTMKILATLSGHHSAVECLVFSADGVHLSSGKYDGYCAYLGIAVTIPRLLLLISGKREGASIRIKHGKIVSCKITN